MKRWLWLMVLMALAVLSSALAVAPKHTQTLRVGPYNLQVNFSEFPLRAGRSLDLTFTPEGGIAGKTGMYRFIHPDRSIRQEAFSPLPHFPRDRSVWGFDSIALPNQGLFQLELMINGHTARLPLEVLERPAVSPAA